MPYTVSYAELTICKLPNSNICSAYLNFQEIFLYMFLYDRYESCIHADRKSQIDDEVTIV